MSERIVRNINKIRRPFKNEQSRTSKIRKCFFEQPPIEIPVINTDDDEVCLFSGGYKGYSIINKKTGELIGYSYKLEPVIETDLAQQLVSMTCDREVSDAIEILSITEHLPICNITSEGISWVLPKDPEEEITGMMICRINHQGITLDKDNAEGLLGDDGQWRGNILKYRFYPWEDKMRFDLDLIDLSAGESIDTLRHAFNIVPRLEFIINPLPNIQHLLESTVTEFGILPPEEQAIREILDYRATMDKTTLDIY